MPVHAQNSESTRVHRVVLSGVAVAILAIGLRVAAVEPVVAAAAAAVVALGALATGLLLHGRHHSRRWQLTWVLLASTVAVQTLTTTRAAFGGLPTTYPASLDWVGVACALVAALAL